MEINVAVIGAVDNAKTTTISCLKYDKLDDGRGSARQKIFQFPHERESGRTSSISKVYMKTNDGNHVSFIDLAGHEKYLRTTLHGITGHDIHYAMIVVGANMGVSKMTKEHFSVVVSMRIPLFIVITKADICPANIMNETIDDIKKLIRRVPKKYEENIHMIENHQDINQTIVNFSQRDYFNYCPVFITSNKTGLNLDLLKHFFNNLPPTIENLSKIDTEQTVFRIHEKFSVKGVGIVVSGLLVKGLIKKGDQLEVGPIKGSWASATVRSIHNNFREEIPELRQNQSGCLALNFSDKKLRVNRNKIRKGAIVCDKRYPLTWKFMAHIAITAGHSTTISMNYQPIINCKTIVQSARICWMDNPIVRSGDVCKIQFHFSYRPEFINQGDIFIFREGNLRGIGKIVEILPDSEEKEKLVSGLKKLSKKERKNKWQTLSKN